MKFSKKGQIKFDQYLYKYSTYVSGLRTNAPTPLEFDPSDFKDMIMFTVKEVKEIKTFLDDAVELHDKGVVVIQSTGFDTIQLIKERIKQIEMSIAST